MEALPVYPVAPAPSAATPQTTNAVSVTRQATVPPVGSPRIYPQSHGKFEEGVRSQPQEAFSYVAGEQTEKKQEGRLGLRKKASLFWMALKTKAALHKAL